MAWTGSAPNQTVQRTDGTRSGTQVWQQADSAGVDIVAPDHDVHDQDLADMINACVKKDGGNTATANLPMGGFRHTNVGAASAVSDYARLSDVVAQKAMYASTVSGTNAITLTTGYTNTAYAAGQRFSFIVAVTNTGAVTVNVDSLGAKAIVRNDGAHTALVAGDLVANAIAVIEYDGTRFKLISAAASATSSDVLARIVKAGSILAWPHGTVPTGWLECNGATISRTTYAELFANIGTYYGVGDGSTTFKIPDYRGYFLRGHDSGAGIDPNAGTRSDRGDGTGGDNVGSKQTSATVSHTHTGSVSITGTAASGGVDHSHTWSFSGTSGAESSHTHGISITSGNESAGHTHALTAASAVSNGAHTHTGTTGNPSVNHTHVVEYGTGDIADTGGGFTAVTQIGTGGITSASSQGQSANHTHTFTSDSDGAHTHTLSGTTDGASASHTHTVVGTSAAGSSHTHSISGSGTTSAASAYLHTHTVTGSGSFTSDATGASTETRPSNINVKWIILALPAAASASTLGVNGFQFAFDTGTTDADPGSGRLRFNNGTLSSAIQLYISETDANSASLSAYLATLDDSTSTIRGHLHFYKIGAPGTFAVFSISGAITDAGAYDKFTCAYVSGAGSFANGDNISVLFYRTGDKGDTGATGGGIGYNFATSTTDSDPGSGNLRANNASLASATQLYVDLVDSAGATQTTWLDSLDDSTDPSVKGTIQITKNASSTTFALYQLTSVTTASGYRKLNVTYLTGNGTLADTDAISVVFVRTGNAGVNAGVGYNWDTDNTDSDPGDGDIKANNASLASATEFYVDLVDRNGATQTAWLDALDDSTSTVKGYLTVTKQALSSAFALYSLTSVTTASGYRKLNVTYLTGVGSFSSGDVLSLNFMRTGDKGDTGTAGSNGSNGTNGSNGIDSGIRWNFESSTTMAVPASGGLRLNNATLSSVTAAALNANCAETGNPSVLQFLQAWDDSTNTSLRGTIIVKKTSAPENFAIYNLTGALVDNTTWVELALTYVKHGGSFSAADSLSVAFFRTGDRGATGAGTGDLLAANNLADVANAATSFANIKQAATDTASGVVELATAAEAGTGTDSTRAVTAAGLFTATADVSSATTVDLGAVASPSVRITGSTGPIASFGTANAGIYRRVRFASTPTLTHHATQLILPSGADITAAADDTLEAVSLGSGNWFVLRYDRKSGYPLTAAQATIASASTVDLGSTVAQAIAVSGSTGPITSFGSTAPTGAVKFVSFASTPTLTHNGTSLILPGAADVTAVAGDTLVARHEGSGNWRVLSYQRSAAKPLPTSTTDNAVARYDGTAGSLQNSGVIVDDSNNVSGIGTLGVGAITTTGLLTAALAGNTARFVNTTDSASVQVARFEGDRATMADNDAAYISLMLSDDGGTQTEFARITWQATDVNAGTSVDGLLAFHVVTAGSLGAELLLTGANLYPFANDGLALGLSGQGFSDLFLASGAVINFDAGDVTITHASNTLAFAGGSSGYTFDAVVSPASSDGAALGSASVMWSDLFLASGGVINFNNGDVTVTHASNTLAFAGASSGYAFDALATVTVAGAALRLINTTNSSDVQAAIIEGDRSAPATNDSAHMSLRLSNGSGTQTEFARMTWTGTDVTASSEDGQLSWYVMVAGTTTQRLALSGTNLFPTTNDALALGLAGAAFSDLFLAEGGVINWDSGDVTITQTGNVLSFAGASTRYEFDANLTPTSSDGAALGTTGLMFSDLFLASGGVINWNNGNVTLTHAANALTIAGLGVLTLPVMTISSSGNIGVGGNANIAVTNGNSNYSMQTQSSATSGDFGIFGFYDGAGTNVGTIVGDATNNNTAYNTTSDGRLKTVVGELMIGDEIDRLRPVKFLWKHKPDSPVQTGFVAQEIHEVFPRAATQPHDGADVWMTDEAKLMPLVVAELKALRKRVRELEAT